MTVERHGNAFDALRLMAAVLVVLQHSAQPFGDEGLGRAVSLLDGVGVFFVISGMFVFRSAQRALRGRKWGSYARSRYFRVVPALVPFVLLAPVIAVISSSQPTRSTVGETVWWFVGPFVGVPLAEPGFFGDARVNGQLWTIPVEMSFYAVLPQIGRAHV